MEELSYLPNELFENVIKQGDAKTLLTLLSSTPSLSRLEQQNPNEFWKKAYAFFFPEYNNFLEYVYVGNYRKLVLWLTWSHSRILKWISKQYKGMSLVIENDIVDTTRVIQDGTLYTTREWATYWGFLNGRLFGFGYKRGKRNRDQEAKIFYMARDLAEYLYDVTDETSLSRVHTYKFETHFDKENKVVPGGFEFIEKTYILCNLYNMVMESYQDDTVDFDFEEEIQFWNSLPAAPRNNNTGMQQLGKQAFFGKKIE